MDSDFQRETAPKGVTGTSIDNFLGTNGSSKLVNVYNDDVIWAYNELEIEEKVIVPIKDYILCLSKDFSDKKLQTLSMHKDRFVINDPPAPFCWFPTIPMNFGVEFWEVVLEN